jgi:hypothetical protein
MSAVGDIFLDDGLAAWLVQMDINATHCLSR